MARRRGNGRGSLFQRTVGGMWIMSWWTHDGQRREESSGTTCRATAERMLARETDLEAQRRRGTIDPRAESLAQQSRQPISEHLADFKAALTAGGASPRHVDLLHGRAKRVIDGCGFKTWADVSASRVLAYLNDLRQDTDTRDADGKVIDTKRGIGAQTFNFYLQAIKQFGRWMVKDRRAADSSLSHLQGLNVKTDRRRDRRALSADELRRLIDTTASGPERERMTGAARALLYRLAVETGLRSGELRSLTRASFAFDGETPTVTVGAAYSKRRREDTLPLRPALAEALRAFLASKLPTASAFNMPEDRRDMSNVFKADRDAAGIAERDAAGKVADFHALRHTFISNLAAGGVHPKVAQTLARHSTITLTMDRYTHQYAGDELAALDVLPDLSAAPQTALATGTDGVGVGGGFRSSPRSSGAKPREVGAQRRDDAAPRLRVSGGMADARKPLENAGKRDAAQRGARECESGGDGIRTHDDPKAMPVFKTGANPHNSPGNTADSDKASAVAHAVASKIDPDLTRLVDAWPTLPAAVKAGIVAMVEATDRR